VARPIIRPASAGKPIGFTYTCGVLEAAFVTTRASAFGAPFARRLKDALLCHRQASFGYEMLEFVCPHAGQRHESPRFR
jgi:hypothetical protein